MILVTMENFLLESQTEQKALASVKVLQNEDSKEFPPIACRSGVLLDGGTSHTVNYCSEYLKGQLRSR